MFHDSRESCLRTRLSRMIALAVVLIDVIEHRYPLQLGSQLLALCGMVGVLCLRDGHEPLLGMRTLPATEWHAWIRLGVLSAVGMGLVLALFALVWWLLEWRIPIYRNPPSGSLFVWMCLHAPVVEEIIYRSLLRVAAVTAIGERGTILVSGLIFGLVHLLRGIPSPENLLGGFVLAWALARSGTILVPMALHSAGNFLALTGQVAAWYWLAPAV